MLFNPVVLLLVAGNVAAAQVTPLADCSMVPELPTATNTPLRTTRFKLFVVPDVCNPQILPVAENTIVPASPMATQPKAPQLRLFKSLVPAPDVFVIQSVPLFTETKRAPESPTVIYSLLKNAMSLRVVVAKDEVLVDHVV